jgi:hypothetical protein
MTIKSVVVAGVLAVASLSVASIAQAQTELGQNLLPWGAEKGASADGLVPAYTGGIDAVPGLPAASPEIGYPNPFANEKPLFVVTAANSAQYANMLTEGEVAMLQRYPNEFQMPVYPSHRTFTYPEWARQNSIKNATSARQVGSQGDGVENAYGGVPFPIPKDGYEVMWNALTFYRPAYCHEVSNNFMVDASGTVTELGSIDVRWLEPWYDPNAKALPNTFFKTLYSRYLTPPAKAGSSFLFYYPVNFQKSDEVTWFYDPGTRRVRLAPEFKYDTPIASYGGAIDYDEIDVFNGRMDKFDFKLVGKKELIVPYNDYGLNNTTENALLGPHVVKSDQVRWEVHRVWVVEATLKAGARHKFSKWTFFVDEDWLNFAATQAYDHAGNLYRVAFYYPYETYGAAAGPSSMTNSAGLYDLSKGMYVLADVHTASGHGWTCQANMPNVSEFTPQALASQGVR